MESDEEMMYDDCDSGNESSGTDDVDYPYEILTTEQILQHMNECIRQVNVVIEMPSTIIRMLLNHFRWDKEKLMESYYDGDREQLFSEARVADPFKSANNVEKDWRTRKVEECEICLSELVASMMTGLECGHRFCHDCWAEYLTTKVMCEGIGQTISCAAHECEVLIDDATVVKLVPDAKVRQKYQHLITNSFVECNSLLRWCPSANCGSAIRVQHAESRPVTCGCKHTFCFACGNDWHEPVGCNLLRKWIKKCEEDSGTSNWISANTKECPKCQTAVEKSGGCNIMVCRNSQCKTTFCWLCLKPRLFHRCNGYAESKLRVPESRAALQRYLFYYNRYMNHRQSMRLEHKLYSTVKEKMEEMQQHNMSWIEVQFLNQAVEILVQCRRTLMYTYVFAYYLQKNNQSVIFEDNQNDLETATETLSGHLERDITQENLVDIKQKVQDEYRYCDSRRRVLAQHVQEGYDRHWWTCIDVQ